MRSIHAPFHALQLVRLHLFGRTIKSNRYVWFLHSSIPCLLNEQNVIKSLIGFTELWLSDNYSRFTLANLRKHSGSFFCRSKTYGLADEIYSRRQFWKITVRTNEIWILKLRFISRNSHKKRRRPCTFGCETQNKFLYAYLISEAHTYRIQYESWHFRNSLEHNSNYNFSIDSIGRRKEGHSSSPELVLKTIDGLSISVRKPRENEFNFFFRKKWN